MQMTTVQRCRTKKKEKTNKKKSGIIMWGNDLPRFTECSSTRAYIIVKSDLAH